MKRFFPLLLILVNCYNIAHSQSSEIKGKAITEIFTDFHYNFNDTLKTTGFGINRAFLGYNFLPEGNFSGKVIVNIGSPDDNEDGALHLRHAYFREASVSYAKNDLTVSFGITPTRLFDFQQRFWGKRYIANTYQSINDYGYVADLGLTADYVFIDIFKADITIMNGEGFSEIEPDNSLRSSIGFTITPSEETAIRLYADISRPHGVYQNTLIGFAGFKNELVTIGAEASWKSNLDLITGHHAWGLSATGAISVTEKTEIFARCDYSSSVIPEGNLIKWNYRDDYTFAVFGFQYTIHKNLRISLNYQGKYPYNPGFRTTDAIYLNAHFRF